MWSLFILIAVLFSDLEMHMPTIKTIHSVYYKQDAILLVATKSLKNAFIGFVLLYIPTCVALHLSN